MPSIVVQQDADQEASAPSTQEPVQALNTEVPAVTPVTSKRVGTKLLILLVVAIFVGLIAGLAFVLKDRSDLKKEVSQLSQPSVQTNAQLSAEQEAKQLDTDVRKIVEIQGGEVPTIATVSDINKLKQQSTGFDNALNGDKLLIYTQSKQVVVYRPSTKKIVSFSQITVGQATVPQSGTTKKQ